MQIQTHYKIGIDGRLLGMKTLWPGMTLDDPSSCITDPPPDDALQAGLDWFWVGGVWESREPDVPSIPPEPVFPAVTRAGLISDLAARRYRAEIGGTTLGGTTILTGRNDQAMTTQAYVTLLNGLVPGIDWKGAGGWRRVTLPDLEPIARAVAAHVQRCFSTERIVSELIATADPLTFDLPAAWEAAWSATA